MLISGQTDRPKYFRVELNVQLPRKLSGPDILSVVATVALLPLLIAEQVRYEAIMASLRFNIASFPFPKQSVTQSRWIDSQLKT